MADQSEFIRVAKDLLREVLQDASNNRHLAQSQFSCSSKDDDEFAAQQQKIDLLWDALHAAPTPRP